MFNSSKINYQTLISIFDCGKAQPPEKFGMDHILTGRAAWKLSQAGALRRLKKCIMYLRYRQEVLADYERARQTGHAGIVPRVIAELQPVGAD